MLFIDKRELCRTDQYDHIFVCQESKQDHLCMLAKKKLIIIINLLIKGKRREATLQNMLLLVS